MKWGEERDLRTVIINWQYHDRINEQEWIML